MTRKLSTTPDAIRMRNKRRDDPEYAKLLSNKKAQKYRNDPEYAAGVKQRIREKRLANPEWYLWDKARRRANYHKVPFTITLEDVIISPHCPVLGIPMKPLGRKNGGASPSIDRVIPEKGYVPGNIVVISHRANQLKSDATLDELSRLFHFYQAFASDQRKRTAGRRDDLDLSERASRDPNDPRGRLK